MKKFLNLVTLLFLASGAVAKDDEAQMMVEVIKKYPATDKSVLNLDVSFANLSVRYEQVGEITIVMKATGLKEEDQCKQEVVDHFHGATRASSNGVIIKLNGVFDKCKERKSCNVKVSVEITMPLKASMEGTTSFTNIMLFSAQGRVKLHSDYGNFVADGLWAYDNELKVEFGNVEIKGTNGGRFDVEYGNIEIGNVQGSAIVDVEFGNIELQKVMAQCTHLNVKAAYGNVDLTLDAAASYTFETHSAYGNISLDSPLKVSMSDKDYTEVTKKGTIGNGSGKLFINVEFGNIDVNVQ